MMMKGREKWIQYDRLKTHTHHNKEDDQKEKDEVKENGDKIEANEKGSTTDHAQQQTSEKGSTTDHVQQLAREKESTTDYAQQQAKKIKV